MRRVTLIFAFPLLAALGCSCPCHQKSATRPALTLDDVYYEPSHASALVFDPPIIQNDAPVDLARAGRERSAFVGFDQLSTSYIYVRTDDRWSADGNDRYERRAIIEKVGASTR